MSGCSVEGCEGAHKAKGMCNRHWYRDRYTNKPLTEPFQQRQPGVWTEWQVSNLGYVVRNMTVDGRTVHQAQHRYVMEEALGRKLIKGENVHHLNGNRADNRLENLELWVTAQPKGLRVEDMIAWAVEFLEAHGYEPKPKRQQIVLTNGEDDDAE